MAHSDSVSKKTVTARASFDWSSEIQNAFDQIQKDDDTNDSNTNSLWRNYIGQEYARKVASLVVQTCNFRLKSKKRSLVLLLLGPSGTGKTEMARRIASHINKSTKGHENYPLIYISMNAAPGTSIANLLGGEIGLLAYIQTYS